MKCRALLLLLLIFFISYISYASNNCVEHLEKGKVKYLSTDVSDSEILRNLTNFSYHIDFLNILESYYSDYSKDRKDTTFDSYMKEKDYLLKEVFSLPPFGGGDAEASLYIYAASVVWRVKGKSKDQLMRLNIPEFSEVIDQMLKEIKEAPVSELKTSIENRIKKMKLDNRYNYYETLKISVEFSFLMSNSRSGNIEGNDIGLLEAVNYALKNSDRLVLLPTFRNLTIRTFINTLHLGGMWGWVSSKKGKFDNRGPLDPIYLLAHDWSLVGHLSIYEQNPDYSPSKSDTVILRKLAKYIGNSNIPREYELLLFHIFHEVLSLSEMTNGAQYDAIGSDFKKIRNSSHKKNIIFKEVFDGIYKKGERYEDIEKYKGITLIELENAIKKIFEFLDR